jgi:hypothetical protein
MTRYCEFRSIILRINCNISSTEADHLNAPHYPSAIEHMEEPDDEYQEDSAAPSHELRAYKALLSTASAIHRKEYDSICLRVTNALGRFKIAKQITPELREEIRVLKIGVDAQCISVAGDWLSLSSLLVVIISSELYL